MKIYHPTTISPTQETPSMFNKVVLSPNPAGKIVQLTFIPEFSGNVLIEIWDEMGRIVQEKRLNVSSKQQYQQAIDISSLAAGKYFVKLTNGHNWTAKNFDKKIVVA